MSLCLHGTCGLMEKMNLNHVISQGWVLFEMDHLVVQPSAGQLSILQTLLPWAFPVALHNRKRLGLPQGRAEPGSALRGLLVNSQPAFSRPFILDTVSAAPYSLLGSFAFLSSAAIPVQANLNFYLHTKIVVCSFPPFSATLNKSGPHRCIPCCLLQ